MQGKVEICGVNTSKLTVLKNDETMCLLTKARSGDAFSRDELVAGNLKLVLAVLHKFTGRGEPSDDLFQIGCIGLIKAIDNFDPVHGVRFSTYAVPMIIGELRRFLRDNSPVRVSRSMRDNAYKALTAKEEFIARYQREPTAEELAKNLGLKREDVIFALDAIADPVSLYDPIYQDGGDTICVMDQIRDTMSTDDNWIEQISIKQAVTDLDDREKRILALRFYDGKTQTEVAKEIGISQAQVSRLEKGVIEKVKKRLA
ncbi:MAG: RNA polymerase sporulation sigma factor SigG [Clostridia bacterium]|nr:RNA polymerase sporulation sigma factor SigG [Clostridia bacterium]